MKIILVSVLVASGFVVAGEKPTNNKEQWELSFEERLAQARADRARCTERKKDEQNHERFRSERPGSGFPSH